MRAAIAIGPTPADEREDLEIYRSAFHLALMAEDWLVVDRLPAQIRGKRWPTMLAEATNLAREADLAFQYECEKLLPLTTARLQGGRLVLAPIGGGR